MKWMATVFFLTTISHTQLTSAQPPWSNFLTKSLNRLTGQSQESLMGMQDTRPGGGHRDGEKRPEGSTIVSDLTLADVIGKERGINIFAGFTRDVDDVAKRLDDLQGQVTVLAPLNSALQSLPRKPWEDPEEYNAMGAEAYKGESGEDRATTNLRRFVEAHIIPMSPWKEGQKVASLRGEQVWWESKDGKKLVQPGDIEVASTASKASNGEIWQLKGCVNYK